MNAVTSDLSTWLREQRQARGWTKREMTRKFIAAGQAAGDHMPGPDDMWRYIHRWETGETGITERYARHYCTIFGIPLASFGTAPIPAVPSPWPGLAPPAPALATPVLPAQPPAAAQPPAPAQPPAMVVPAQPSAVTIPARTPALASVVPISPGLPAPATLACDAAHGSGRNDPAIAREVLMGAHEASEHAEQAGHAGVGEATLDQLRDDVRRLALLTDSSEPVAVYLESQRVRDRVYRVLDQRMWPREQTDLYLLLGCLNGLMGVAAHRLGYLDAAAELDRAGWAYANAIGHRPLMAWLRCEHSCFAYFRGRFEESLDMACIGLENLSAGPWAAHLHINRARAAAETGDADAARQAVQAAHEARESDYHDELTELGGAFTISLATHYGLAGSALAVAQGAEGEAVAELEQAIGRYDRGPAEREDFWYAGKPLAGIDLAVARVRSGALDAAVEALQPALSLPGGKRISDVTIRLAALRRELAAPIFARSPQARDLGGQIEEFTREAVAELHIPPG
jgi:tetratricopeptide (TPR) repeat protein